MRTYIDLDPADLSHIMAQRRAIRTGSGYGERPFGPGLQINRASPLATGLVDVWSAEAGSRGMVSLSGYHQPTTNTSIPSRNISPVGRMGQLRTFNATNPAGAKIVIPHAATQSIAGSKSLMCWYYADSGKTAFGNQQLVKKNLEYILRLNSAGSAFLWIVWTNSVARSITFGTGTAYTGWHCLVGTLAGGTGTIYVDGAFGNSGSCPGTVNTSTQDIGIGADPGGSEQFYGDIALVALWNGALSAEKVAALYRPTSRWSFLTMPARKLWLDMGAVDAVVRPKATAYRRPDFIPPRLSDHPINRELVFFSDGIVNRQNLAANLHHLAAVEEYALVNTYSAPVARGAGAMLHGWGTYLVDDALYSNEFGPAFTPPMTMAAWVRLPTDPTVSQPVGSVGLISGTRNVHYIVVTGTDGGSTVACRSQAGGQPFVSAETTASYPIGEWFLVTGVWRTSSDRSAYLNGQHRGDNTDTKTVVTAQTVCFGGYLNGSGGPSNRMANGEIAAMRIWKRALSDAEILSLYRESSRWHCYRQQAPRNVVLPADLTAAEISRFPPGLLTGGYLGSGFFTGGRL